MNESSVRITASPNGPLRVTGTCVIVDDLGKETVKNESFSLCRCGASANKPFCDGNHRRIGFRSGPEASSA